jgi:hypothetical protein
MGKEVGDTEFHPLMWEGFPGLEVRRTPPEWKELGLGMARKQQLTGDIRLFSSSPLGLPSSGLPRWSNPLDPNIFALL